MKLRSLLAPLLVVFVPALLGACTAPMEDEDEVDDDDLGMTESALAEPGGWKPPQAVVKAGDQHSIAYDDAPAWNGGKNCGGKFLPGTKELAEFLKDKFSQVSSYGGYSCRKNTANAKQTSVHGTGRAIDVFIPLAGKQADNTKGDAVANWLVTNAASIGVQYIIWDRTSWNASRKSGSKVKGYGGPHPHHDHIHVELTKEGAARQTPFFEGGDSTTEDSPAPAAGGDAAGGEGCASATLGRIVVEGGCVQRRKDERWFRCQDGAWVESTRTDKLCTGRHPL